MYPLVSIIIPTYNRSRFIGEALDSIISQTYPHWECLVIDDGSTDDSESVIMSYCEKDLRIQYYKRPISRIKGANACRNYGLELSQGAYINWLDSDDLMHPDKLKLQIQVLENSNSSFCICQSLVFENSIDNILGLKSRQLITDTPFEDFIQQKLIIPIQAPVFNRTFLETHKYRFDEGLQAAQEWYFFARILFEHTKYAIVEQPLDYIRKHSNNISNTNSKNKNWHYFLARFQLYNDLKSKLSAESVDILYRYFLFFYKSFVRTGQFKHAIYVWRLCLIHVKPLRLQDHFYLITGCITYSLFRKGDGLLAKVSLL
ncbi:glycosyltransferase family 2 protein [Geojedonia litorea]|uniref:Glycosyltransferase family 2 protein n=1 Tax=Geojedonia litorea TaxID=1268269 RepID=A0ABV9N1P2_9FLAO